MNHILKNYNALLSSSPRSEVSDILDSIIYAPLFTFDKESRADLIKAILQDLKHSGSKGKLTSKDAAQALLAVKTLGKDPSGSAVLATSGNLSTLLSFSTTFKDDNAASCEALRCIANALLLVDSARSTFITKEVNGGETCITMLEKSTTPDYIFILSRILFLSTASGPSYLETVVEGKYHGRTIVDILGSKLDLMTTSFRNGTPLAKEALIDVLKFIFNLVCHYPKMVHSEPQHSETNDDKVMGDYWNSRLDGILPSLLRTFANLPPTSPAPIAAPLTHVIHSLITIPVNATLKPIWLGQAVTTSSARNSTTNSPKTRTPHESAPESRSDSPTRPSQSGSPIISTLDRALSSVISAGRRSLSRTSSHSPTSPPVDVLQRSFELLDQALAHYFPGNVEVDDPSVRQRAKAESTDSLDDTLSPLVVLVTRLCISDEGSRARTRQWLVPEDLDRTSPLEQRSDLLGRCLRLLASVYFPRLKDMVGELLFAISDSNATTLSALVGYGNVAGFLFHKGIMSAPPQPDSGPVPMTTSDGVPINPITGTTEEKKPELPEMSDDEKEREMEKLFVLFDRLEKTGALPKEQNPIRNAIQSGKLG